MGQDKGIDWFKRTVDIVTLVIIAGGFWMAIDQAKKLTETIVEAQRSSDLASWNSVSQQWLSMDNVFVQHPEFRPYIYEGKDAADTEAAFEEKKAVAVLVLDFIDYAVSTYSDLLNERRTRALLHPEGWADQFLEIFSHSPVVCRTLFLNEQVYSPTTRTLGHKACSPAWRMQSLPPT